MMKLNITASQYARAVGDGMTEREAAAQLAAAEVEAAYLKATSTGRKTTRYKLMIALIAYTNGAPLPPMSRRVKEKFNQAVKPYGDLLRAESETAAQYGK